MAAEGYIQVNPATQMGSLAVQIRDLIVQLIDRTEELGEALGQAAADDNTNAKLQTILGTASTDNAVEVKNLVGTVRTNVNDANNAFLQYAARVNRNF